MEVLVDWFQSLRAMESNAEHSSCHGSALWPIILFFVCSFPIQTAKADSTLLPCIYILSHGSSYESELRLQHAGPGHLQSFDFSESRG